MMKIFRLASVFGALLLLSAGACAVEGEEDAVGIVFQETIKTDQRKIYVHMMPWFERNGLHWNTSRASGRRHYNPQIGTYHSGDYFVIEYQFLLMKYAGIDGVIIDWPGRSNTPADLPDNAENTDQIINETAKFGMEFAVMFEDQYATSQSNAVTSMNWVRDHYFNKPNHIKVNGAPALFVFGPQQFGAGSWPTILAGTGTDPAFFTLWYNAGAGGARDGTFAWIFQDATPALTHVEDYYKRTDQGMKFPVLFPGFNAAYDNGHLPWKVGYDVGGDTLTSLWDLILKAGNNVLPMVQIATWNDYTEGTMIEPTNEFGYRFLTTLQGLLGSMYGQEELEIVRLLYNRRNANNDSNAEAASQALIRLDVAGACAILGCTAPVRAPIQMGSGGPSGSGSGGTNNGDGVSSGGTNDTGAPGDSTGAPGDSTGAPGDSTGEPGDSTGEPGDSTSPPTDGVPGEEGRSPESDARNGARAGCTVSGPTTPAHRSSVLYGFLAATLALFMRRRRVAQAN